MTREDILQFGLATAKDEYLRGQSRLALVETKAQLVSATAGVLLAFFATIPFTDLPHSKPSYVMGLIACVASLVASLIWSVAASLLVDVRPPQDVDRTCRQCQELIGASGETTKTVDAAAAERLVGNLCGSYQVASQEVGLLLKKRMLRLKAAQAALVSGIVLMILLLGIPYLGKAVAVLKTGVSCHG